MYKSADTLDDLLRWVLEKLLKSKPRVVATRGSTRELFGVLLELKNPLARLSRTERKGKLFSGLGELLWYLAKTNELAFIAYYAPNYADNSDDGETLHGAYGPRLFNMHGHNQVNNVIALLQERPTSRRAVIQLFDAGDLAKPYGEIPCTCTLQFLVRDNRLHMLTTMRSNDAFVGLPHDIFAFTMLQEVFARTLKLELGTYKHLVTSLHLYDENEGDAKAFLKEGWQATVSMPRMPDGDPWTSVRDVLRAERALREVGSFVRQNSVQLPPYWEDIVLLLRIYRKFIDDKRGDILSLKKKMTSRVFDPYIESKRRVKRKARPPHPVSRSRQLPLF